MGPIKLDLNEELGSLKALILSIFAFAKKEGGSPITEGLSI